MYLEYEYIQYYFYIYIIDYDGIRVGIGVFSFYAFLNNVDKEMNKSRLVIFFLL